MALRWVHESCHDMRMLLFKIVSLPCATKAFVLERITLRFSSRQFNYLQGLFREGERDGRWDIMMDVLLINTGW